MPFCKNCGEEITEGASYCRKCGAPIGRIQEQVLAGWGERFIAWLIDMIVLGIVLAWFSLPGFNWISRFWRGAFPDWIPAIDVFGQPYDASQRMEDECDPTPVEATSWGAIKSLYR